MVRLSQIVLRTAESRRPRSRFYLYEPEMIAAIRAAILKPQGYCSHLKSAFFHSTPVLQRKHQSFDSMDNYCFDLRFFISVRTQKLAKDWEERNRNGRHIPHNLDKRCFDEEFNIDYILRTALGGSRGFSCSFTHEEGKPRGRAKNFSWSNCHEESKPRSEKYSNNFRRSRGSRHRLDEEEDDGYSSTESSDSELNQESHRQTLGLSVKIAYRASALKWHPDRHQESTKNTAEEKFKLCTVAYQSLCKRLAMD